jgi:hypothetical protein
LSDLIRSQASRTFREVGDAIEGDQILVECRKPAALALSKKADWENNTLSINFVKVRMSRPSHNKIRR